MGFLICALLAFFWVCDWSGDLLAKTDKAYKRFHHLQSSNKLVRPMDHETLKTQQAATEKLLALKAHCIHMQVLLMRIVLLEAALTQFRDVREELALSGMQTAYDALKDSTRHLLPF